MPCRRQRPSTSSATSGPGWGVSPSKVLPPGGRAPLRPTATRLRLPHSLSFNPYDHAQHFLEIFNRRQTHSFNYTITCPDPWVQISSDHGAVDSETIVWVNINWAAGALRQEGDPP